MKRLVILGLLLFGCVEVMAQGSAPAPAQVFRRKGTSDTAYMLVKGTTDTIMIYDTAGYTKFDLRGTNQAWLIPDTVQSVVLRGSDKVYSSSLLEIAGTGFIMNTFAEANDTIYSLLGNGLEKQNGYLTVTLGASIEGSEITNQTIGKVDIDTTATFPFGALYHKSTAVGDSEYKTKYYIDNNLFGYTVSGSPTGGQVPVFDGGAGGWSFGSGGAGSGDDMQFDMTVDNSDYVIGAVTYTGGYINTSTVWQRGDTGLNLLKSGQHPGDTIIHRIDWARVMRNNGSQYAYNFQSADGDTMGAITDSSTYTLWRTGGGNTGGLKFINNMGIHGSLRFYGATRKIDSAARLTGAPDGTEFYLDDEDGLLIQSLVTDKSVSFGSSTNWTLHSDTLRGTGSASKIFDVGRVTVDTLNAARELMQAGKFGIITSTDTAAMFTRDTANDTTTMQIVGNFKITANDGLTEFDSAVYHGRIRMYDGTNKSRLDSASSVSADTLKTLPGGFLTLQGATSGRTRFKGNASAITSYDLVLPTAQGSANQALINDGSGNLSWGSAGTGNGSADFDTVASLDTVVLKGSGGTVLMDVHKTSGSVVIGKGVTMTSLILGGNSSALSSVDTSMLIYKSLDFGNGFDDVARLDSARIWNAVRQNRRYFNFGDIYFHPERALTFGIRGTWGWVDSAGVTDTAITTHLFTIMDTSGSNASYYPIHFRVNAAERDSLFSFVFKYKTGAGTDTTTNGITKAVLAVNGSRVDSVTARNLFSSTLATDSMNFTDRALAQGDLVTILLYCRTNPAAALRWITIDEAYLNMRRY